MYNISDRPKKIIVSLRHEKAIVLKELEKTQLSLNAIKTDNKILAEKLIVEKKKIAALISSLKNKNLSKKNINIYKNDADFTNKRIKTLITEISTFKKKNDSISGVLKKEKRKNDTLKNFNVRLRKTNKKLLDKITQASSLNYYGLETSFYKAKSDKKETETTNASRINTIRIRFSIAENKLIKPINKNFYIQIIDPKNNVVGNKEALNFGEDILVVSSEIKVRYENQNTTVSSDIPVKKLEKGSYSVYVYDNSKRILQSTFILNWQHNKDFE